jgi:hypothetical protein
MRTMHSVVSLRCSPRGERQLELQEISWQRGLRSRAVSVRHDPKLGSRLQLCLMIEAARMGHGNTVSLTEFLMTVRALSCCRTTYI